MRVSVVVNNHDYRRFLGACIESALAQTHADVEVVVVDDGSTDGSADVVRAYGRRVIPVLKPNGGQASAFNAGFAAASGDAVIFLDADDLLEPSAAAVAACLLADPAVVKVHWPLAVVDGSGAPTGALKPAPAADLPDGDLRESVFRSGPTCLLSPPTSGNAWSRAFLERLLPMDEPAFRLGADTLLFELAPFAGRLRRWPEPLSRYRSHGGNRWRSLGFEEILRRELRFYRACVPLAAAIAAEQGASVDPERWLERSWWHRLERAVRAVDEAVGPAPFLLADEGSWGLTAGGGRQPRPFLGRDGIHWGSPSDDAHAISALERERAAGAAALVVGWPSFWWLECYEGFVRYLKERGYRRIRADDAVVIYDLIPVDGGRRRPVPEGRKGGGSPPMDAPPSLRSPAARCRFHLCHAGSPARRGALRPWMA